MNTHELEMGNMPLAFSKVKFNDDPNDLSVLTLDSEGEVIATLFVSNKDDYNKFQAYAMLNGIIAM
ncbi:hypothetical protein [Vibrio owensii]|uniref:hypothetical protein n=1 Tax=Vibrio owensii TaxID=696485 RepID=UPI0018F1903C|nr:hypothetical protein [Vibrio owensii]